MTGWRVLSFLEHSKAMDHSRKSWLSKGSLTWGIQEGEKKTRRGRAWEERTGKGKAREGREGRSTRGKERKRKQRRGREEQLNI